MPQIIEFFPRQAVPPATGVTIYSEIYEVSDYAQIVARLRLDSFSGTGSISAILQDTMEPGLAPDSLWRSVASQSLGSAAGAVFSAGGLLRFVRMKLDASALTGAAMVTVDAVAKEIV